MNFHKTAYFAFFTLSLLSFCARNNTFQNKDGTDGATASPEATSVTASITPENGGQIALQNMKLIIPVGALDQETEITASIVNVTSAAVDGALTIGKGVKFSPEGLQFLKPIEVEFCYPATDVNSKNLNEKSVMVYYAEEGGELVGMSGLVNQERHCVTGNIEHFSVYIPAAQLLIPGNSLPNITGANFLPAGTAIMAGLPVRVRTTINDFNGGGAVGHVVSAFFMYCRTGDATCNLNPATATNKVPMLPDITDGTVTNRYYATIPESFVTLVGFQYRFQASDNIGATRTTAIGTRTVTRTASALRFNPNTAVNITAGFVRDFTLQANDGTAWRNISADIFNVSGSIGTLTRIGPSTLRFSALTAGLGSINAAAGAFNASVAITVQTGALSHIEIMDNNQVIINNPVHIPINGTFQFDALGYDAYGNTVVINPLFAVSGAIGSIDSTALFSAGTTPEIGSITAEIGSVSDTISVHVSNDLTPPVLGSSGSIVAARLTSTSALVTWGKANDNFDAQSSLQYRLYYALTDTIDTVTAIEANGTPLSDYTTDIDNLGVSSLDPESVYFFNIIVKDVAGNKSAGSRTFLDHAGELRQQAYVKAANADAQDIFGHAIAIDGDTLVIGAYLEDSNVNTISNGGTASVDNSTLNSGAVYVYRRSGVNWSQEAYLKPPNNRANHLFGHTVAISGNTIVVGAPGESSSQATVTNGTTASNDNSAPDSGAVYVYKRTGSTWSQEAYVKPPNPESYDNFGFSVAISGDTIIVGARNEDSNQNTITNGAGASNDNSASDSGAAFVYTRVGVIWTQEAYIKAANAKAGDNFGHSVSVSGDTILIGARFEDSNQNFITNGANAPSDSMLPNSGAAYVYRRYSGIWIQEAFLKAPNPDTDSFFGHSVAISGDTIVVGAFQEDSNQTTVSNGPFIGANNFSIDSGGAYVFKRGGTTWAHEAYLKPTNAQAFDGFGFSVAINGDTILVGAYQEDSNQTTTSSGSIASPDNSLTDSGAAYLFKRTGISWSQTAYIKSPNANDGDNFGFPVALSSDTIVIGATQEDSVQNTITNGTGASTDNSAASSGAVYVFK